MTVWWYPRSMTALLSQWTTSCEYYTVLLTLPLDHSKPSIATIINCFSLFHSCTVGMLGFFLAIIFKGKIWTKINFSVKKKLHNLSVIDFRKIRISWEIVCEPTFFLLRPECLLYHLLEHCFESYLKDHALTSQFTPPNMLMTRMISHLLTKIWNETTASGCMRSSLQHL